MKQSHLFYKTTKEVSQEDQGAGMHYLIKGDFIDRLASGIYSFLPLGWRVMSKIIQVIREEMEAIDAQEVFLPSLQPKEIWVESGRWDTMEPPLFKLKDQHDKDFALGPTHEEVITRLVKQRIQSYRDLPAYLFQIQTKFRNEIRSTGGLLRTREFLMKDLYSFHEDQNDLNNYYKKVAEAYEKIFKRLELDFIKVDALSGSIGGESSHEFMVFSDLGEDKIYFCSECHIGFSEEYLIQRNKTTRSNLECSKCKKTLELQSVIECAHIFNLGDKYSKSSKAEFLDQKGQKKPILAGCYGIGLGRLLATIVATHHDDKGIIWPESIAPFTVHVLDLNLGKDKEKKLDQFVKFLEENRIQVLYDNRDVSSGQKLVEADLIGCPLRVIGSEKTLSKEMVELKERNKDNVRLIKLEEAKEEISRYLLI